MPHLEIHHDQVGFILVVQGLFNIRKSINTVHYIYDSKEKKTHRIISAGAENLMIKFKAHYNKILKYMN